MNWKWNERIVFFTIIGILILIITMLIFFPNVETVDDFTTAGYCYGIDDYSIRIENITYHCSLISVENKDSYVGNPVEVRMSCDNNLLFHVKSVREIDLR
jgi:hypothetical protein